MHLQAQLRPSVTETLCHDRPMIGMHNRQMPSGHMHVTTGQLMIMISTHTNIQYTGNVHNVQTIQKQNSQHINHCLL